MKFSVNNLLQISALVLLSGEMACTNEKIIIPYEDLYDHDNIFVYMQDMPLTSNYNYYFYPSNLNEYTFTTEIPSTVEVGTIRTGMVAEQDIIVTVSIDKSIVDAENEKLLTENPETEIYSIPDCIHLEKTEYRIPSGEYMASEPVRLVYENGLNDMKNFEKSKYMVPVKLTTVSGDSRAKISAQKKITVQTFTYSVRFQGIEVSLGNTWNLPSPKIEFPRGNMGSGPTSGTMSSLNTNVNVTLTSGAPGETHITFAIDNSLVENYNTQHGTDFREMPDGSVKLSQSTMTLSPGATESDNIVLNFPNSMGSLRFGENYIIPVKLESCDGFGCKINDGSNVFYLIIQCVNPPLIEESVDEPKGDLIDNSEFSMTLFMSEISQSDCTSNYNDPMFTSYLSWSTTKNEGMYMIFDMKDIHNLSGLRFQWSWNYYSGVTAPDTYEVGVSEDKVKWNNLGMINDAGYQVIDKAYFSYLNLKEPQNCRYVRIRAFRNTYGDVKSAAVVRPVWFYESK